MYLFYLEKEKIALTFVWKELLPRWIATQIRTGSCQMMVPLSFLGAIICTQKLVAQVTLSHSVKI